MKSESQISVQCNGKDTGLVNDIKLCYKTMGSGEQVKHLTPVVSMNNYEIKYILIILVSRSSTSESLFYWHNFGLLSTNTPFHP